MLRHLAIEKTSVTSGAAKYVLFSSRSKRSCCILKEFEKAFFSRNLSILFAKKQKTTKCTEKSGQRSTFFILICLFFFSSQNACLNFFKSAYEMVWYKKLWTKK